MVGHSAKLLSVIREPAGLSEAPVGPGGRCRQLRAQNLQVLLLWGDDSSAIVYDAGPGHEVSAPHAIIAVRAITGFQTCLTFADLAFLHDRVGA